MRFTPKHDSVPRWLLRQNGLRWLVGTSGRGTTVAEAPPETPTPPPPWQQGGSGASASLAEEGSEAPEPVLPASGLPVAASSQEDSGQTHLRRICADHRISTRSRTAFRNCSRWVEGRRRCTW